MGLILNAVEAMNVFDEEARELQISTEVELAGSVLVTVGDSGPGLDPTSLERLSDDHRGSWGPPDVGLRRSTGSGGGGIHCQDAATTRKPVPRDSRTWSTAV
jgi:signal transduction histidine kinase